MASAASSHPPRAALAALACLQTACFGAIILGWASIAGTLVVAKEDAGGAGLSLQESAQLFSIASSSNMLSCLILGFVLDTFGPRACSMISTLLIGAGCQIVGFSDSMLQYSLGMCLIAIGGPGVASSVFHVTNLFPKQKFFTMNVFNATTNLSFCVFAIFDWLWKHFGFGIHTLFRWYTVVALLSTFTSWLSLPDEPFQDTEEGNDSAVNANDAAPLLHPTPEQDLVEAATKLHLSAEQPLDSFLRVPPKHNLDRSQSNHYSRIALQKGRQELVSLKDQPFWNQVRSGTYLRSLFTVVVTIFCSNFYVASIAIELADQRKFSSEQQHQLSSYLTFAMAWVGFFGSIFVGWLMDLIGLEWTNAISLVLGQLHMLILVFWSDSKWGMLVGFGIYTLFRQFLFPAFLGTVSARLGFKYFGILIGLAFTICGAVQLFMSPLVELVQGSCHRFDVEVDNDNDPFKCHNGNWKQLHLAQLILLFCLLCIPIIDYQEEQSRKRRIQAFLEPSSKNLVYGSTDDV